MQANRKIQLYVSKKAPINMLSRQKAPKCSKVGVTNIQEKQVDLFMTPHEHRL